jgi:phosphatidylinositol glycan class A protein
MICDFFYPNVGGVENHIYYLSQCLIRLGHRVVIVSHTYGDRQGIRHLPKGLKVYYLPFANMALQTTYPTLFFSLPFYYDLFHRERIDLVHGHSAFSTMCEEGILHARMMGIPCVFTDHSLFGFADISSILTNKLLKFLLSDVERVICVSNCSKENTVLRAALDPRNVYVIPNAVLTDQFRPAQPEEAVHACAADRSKFHCAVVHFFTLLCMLYVVTIVVLCRLVYRKGADLLVHVIPEICEQFPQVDFLIAGDGAKKVDLEQMRERHQLHKRVSMIGAVPSEQVRSVLIRGQIFLNTSLTEAFCMAIVEAAACGLYVVSTQVGGIPEVLPEHMITLAEPDSVDLCAKLAGVLKRFQCGTIDTSAFHAEICCMYSWSDVTARTEAVYQTLFDSAAAQAPLLERLRRIWSSGQIAGKFLCVAMVWNWFYWQILRLLCPVKSIEPSFTIK